MCGLLKRAPLQAPASLSNASALSSCGSLLFVGGGARTESSYLGGARTPVVGLERAASLRKAVALLPLSTEVACATNTINV